jgi:hypothetical protein
MHWPSLALAAAAAMILTGCSAGDDPPVPEEQAQQTAAGDSGTAQETPVADPPRVAEPEVTPPARTPVTTTAAVDEPWVATHTGTVNPGMSREEVVGVWGEPVAERMADGRMYLFYRNGCEVTCGTFDVVFLEGGQVVDAIVRARGHTYSGTSSSPAGSEGVPTPPAGQART